MRSHTTQHELIVDEGTAEWRRTAHAVRRFLGKLYDEAARAEH